MHIQYWSYQVTHIFFVAPSARVYTVHAGKSDNKQTKEMCSFFFLFKHFVCLLSFFRFQNHSLSFELFHSLDLLCNQTTLHHRTAVLHRMRPVAYYKCTSLHLVFLYELGEAEVKALESVRVVKCNASWHVLTFCSQYVEGVRLVTLYNQGGFWALQRRQWLTSVVHFLTVDCHNTHMTVTGLPPLPPSSSLCHRWSI